MYLPENLRGELKTPLGTLIKNTDTKKSQIIKEIYAENVVITIGDATSELLINMDLIPFLQIIDGKEKRHERELPTDTSLVTHLHCVNPAGELTQDSIDTIKKSFASKPPIRILVDGEEDLLVLPTCILAPENYVIMYGQPNEGLVIVRITSELQEKVQKMVDSMK